jgi:hypothetical protein
MYAGMCYIGCYILNLCYRIALFCIGRVWPLTRGKSQMKGGNANIIIWWRTGRTETGNYQLTKLQTPKLWVTRSQRTQYIWFNPHRLWLWHGLWILKVWAVKSQAKAMDQELNVQHQQTRIMWENEARDMQAMRWAIEKEKKWQRGGIWPRQRRRGRC